jgi:hypothetical protein
MGSIVNGAPSKLTRRISLASVGSHGKIKLKSKRRHDPDRSSF